MSIYENQKYNSDQLHEIEEGLRSGVDVSQYTTLNSKGKPMFDCYQMRAIREGLEAGLDVSQYAKPEFSEYQMLKIREGLVAGVDVSLFAKPEFDGEQMEQIREGLVAGIDVSAYANPKFDWKQMRQIRFGLEAGLDVSSYAKPEFNALEMSQIQEELIARADKIRAYTELGFNAEQTQELLEGLKSGVDVDVYAKPEYDWYRMHIIRERLEEGFPADYAILASIVNEKQFTPEIENILRSHNFNNDQIYEIHQGIEAGLNVNSYIALNSDGTSFYSADEMHQIRLSLEAGVDINEYITALEWGTCIAFDYDKLQEAREKVYEEQKANKKEEISDEELETYISDEEIEKYDLVTIPEAISNSEKSSGEMLSNDESNYDCL